MQLFYENSRGQTLDLLNDPNFIMTAATGLSSLPQNNISTVETVAVDGDTVMSRKRSSRQVVLTHQLQHNVKESRLNFARVLDQGAKGKLFYSDERVNVYLEVETESCEITTTDFPVIITTTFIANFPYWLDVEAQGLSNKGTNGAWQFPFTFPVTFGQLNSGQAIEIENNGDMAFGFVARMLFSDTTRNPFLQNQEGKKIAFSINRMGRWQGLEISTVQGNKYADLLEYDEEGNITVIRSRLSDVTIDSEFFQLQPGINLISAGASEGAENINLTIEFRAAHKVV